VKLTGARLRGFLAHPDPAILVALIYGPDRGLVHERAQSLVAALAGSPVDPFRCVELSAEQVKADPVRLTDEALALAFGGGRRVVVVREAADAVTAPVRSLLGAGLRQGALIVLVGGDLGKRSPLRQLCEQDAAAAAIPCYEDDQDTLRQVIRETLTAQGLSPTPAALDYLSHSLGADRAITRGELEKLATYAGAGLPGAAAAVVDLDDARAVVDDSHGASLSGIVFAAAAGDTAALDGALHTAWREGLSPVAILRAMAGHVQRLLTARAAIAAGRNAAQAMAALRPPVLFFHQAAFRRQLERCNEAGLAAALSRLVEAELACKTTGAPQRLVCARAVLALCGDWRR
jgi:DNA polymerase-3 subunit delta